MVLLALPPADHLLIKEIAANSRGAVAICVGIG